MYEESVNDQMKDLYAHFGLAYYLSNVLEHGIANALLVLELLEKREEVSQETWEQLVDKHYEASFDKTFGKLKNQIAKHQQDYLELATVIPDIEKCVIERNFLAHHFWRENSMVVLDTDGRKIMIKRLEKARDLFREADKSLDNAMRPLLEHHATQVNDPELAKVINMIAQGNISISLSEC